MQKTNKVILFAMIILFFTGLGLFTYLAVYNRYWADDWCYNADLKQLGFLGTLKGYMYITTYASNRFSLTFFSGLLYYLGIFGVQIMTPLNILLLFVGLYWSLNNIKNMLNFNLSSPVLMLIVAIVIYYSIYLTPNLYQSLYWRSGSLPYFEPMVFSVFIFALVTYQGVLAKRSHLIFVIVAILSLFAGGFSEAGCATLVAALSIYIAIAWILQKQPWVQASLPAAITALCFSLMAMIVLILSPTDGHRLGLYGKQSDFFRLPFLIMSFSFDFVKYSFKDAPLPHMVIISTSLLLGYLLYVPEIRSQIPKLKAQSSNSYRSDNSCNCFYLDRCKLCSQCLHRKNSTCSSNKNNSPLYFNLCFSSHCLDYRLFLAPIFPG